MAKIGIGINWYDRIYDFMRNNPNQKIHWSTIETHLQKMNSGSRFFEADVLRRYISMMTEPKHKKMREKYPALLKMGDGYYKFFPELDTAKSSLSSFFDEDPLKIVITQTQIEITA